MSLQHVCGVDCKPTLSPILRQTVHVMYASEPNSTAGRYQFDENRRILRQGKGARAAWRASGQGETRRNRLHALKSADKRDAMSIGWEGLFFRIGTASLDARYHYSERRIYRAVASQWTPAEDLWDLFLSVQQNIIRQSIHFSRHDRFTDGGYYRDLGSVTLMREDDLTDAHTD